MKNIDSWQTNIAKCIRLNHFIIMGCFILLDFTLNLLEHSLILLLFCIFLLSGIRLYKKNQHNLDEVRCLIAYGLDKPYERQSGKCLALCADQWYLENCPGLATPCMLVTQLWLLWYVFILMFTVVLIMMCGMRNVTLLWRLSECQLLHSCDVCCVICYTNAIIYTIVKSV